MILRQLYLTVDGIDFADALVEVVNTETRCLCGFLERKMAKARFRTDGFKRVVVQGKARPSPFATINSCKVLVSEVQFLPEKYLELRETEKQEYYIELLDKGLAKCASQNNIPLDFLREGMRAFRDGGYENRWTWKRKSVRDLGITVALECEVTMKRFLMTLNVYKKGQLLIQEQVFDLFPDELVFEPKFRDVVIRGSTLEILNRARRVSFRIDLRDIL